MAEEPLPDNFDVVVVGTGLTEAILAAAFSRAELTVLHVDKNDYYGGNWASFNWQSLQSWIGARIKDDSLADASPSDPIGLPSVTLEDGERLVAVEERRAVRNVSSAWHPSATHVPAENTACQSNVGDVSEEVNQAVEVQEDAQDESGQPTGSENQPETQPEPEIVSEPLPSPKDSIEKQWRRFNIDLAPKILRSRGAMVDVLVSSGVGRYAEFKNVDRLLCDIHGSVKQVPCSRGDVFQSAEISMIDKRKLMKFITFCLNEEHNSDEFADVEGMLFRDYLLRHKNMSPDVAVYVEETLGMLPKSATVRQGVHAVRRFVSSVGRYGHSPFLWTLYGSGELPQCFSRLCAVFGGLYSLRKSVQAVVLRHEEGQRDSADISALRCSAIVVDGQRINCQWLVLGADYKLAEVEDTKSPTTSHRGILITNGSIQKDSQKEHISLLNHYNDVVDNPVHLLELSSGAMVCPKEFNLVHLTTEGGSSPPEDALRPTVNRYFCVDGCPDKTACPKVMWHLYFDVARVTAGAMPQNVGVLSNPDASIDYESAVLEAKALFKRMLPDRDFLPPLPPTEDDDDDTARNPTNGFAPPPPQPTDQSPDTAESAQQTTDIGNAHRKEEMQE